jgi:NADPH-dependent curcumin reductase CurA
MADRLNRCWLMAKRPRGAVLVDNFSWGEIPMEEPGPGELLVRNLYLSCEPAQHGWMTVETYWPPINVGEVMRSLALAQVVKSRDPAHREGELVQGLFGWQDYALARPGALYPLLRVPSGVDVQTAMSALGNTGLTAYFGLLDVGRPQPGETVVVSGAAGATGSVVGQIAKLKGCRVVGIAGGEAKCRYLTEVLGFDAAIDYKNENIVSRLRQTCPRGIDVYFDNVGGRTLDAALVYLAMRGRVVICGAMAEYGATAHQGPRNYLQLLRRRGRMEGFVVLDYLDRAEGAMAELAQWMRDGKLRDRVDVLDGLENAPAALLRLFSGENQGKQLVHVADPA